MTLSDCTVRAYQSADRQEWLRLRQTFWPDPTLNLDEQLADMDAWLSQPDTVVLIVDWSGLPGSKCFGLAGFAEVGTRQYAEGCDSSPVAYLEGWYLEPAARRRGVGSALLQAAENWARTRRFTELASDTPVANRLSQSARSACGFTEIERLIAYRKQL